MDRFSKFFPQFIRNEILYVHITKLSTSMRHNVVITLALALL